MARMVCRTPTLPETVVDTHLRPSSGSHRTVIQTPIIWDGRSNSSASPISQTTARKAPSP